MRIDRFCPKMYYFADTPFLRVLALLLGLLFCMLLLPRPSWAKSRLKIRSLTVTAYHLTGRTASGTNARRGCIALSRDLERKFKVKFGDTVIVKGVGRFTFQDRMPKKWRKRVDVFMSSHREAKSFGKKQKAILIVRKSPSKPRHSYPHRKYS